MTKMIRKMVALMLVLTLCAGQLAVAVRAEEGTEVISKTVENGTETTTVVIDASDGTTTTITQTDTVDPGTGTQTSKTEVNITDGNGETIYESEKTDATTVSGSGNRTDVQTDWESTAVEKDSETQIIPPPESGDGETQIGDVTGTTTITTEIDVTTQVQGSETQNETTTCSTNSNTVTTSGTITGSETTTVTGVTTVTTVEEGVMLGEDAKTEDTDTEYLKEQETITGDQDWVPQETTDNDWVNEKPVSGEPGKPTSIPGKSADATPENPYDVTLNLTPGKEDQVKKKITLKDVSDGKYTLPTGKESNVEKLTDSSGKFIGWKVKGKNGDYHIIEENKDGKGNVIGWTVTHKPVESAAPVIPTDPDSQAGKITGDTGWKEVEQTTNYIDKTPEKKAGTVIHEDGSETITTVEKTYHENGAFKGYKVTEVTIRKTDNAASPTVTGSDRETEYPEDKVNTGFALPVNVPESGTTTDENGNVITVTVTDLVENGVHVGYTVTTETISKTGEYVRTETEKLYGTESTEVIDVAKDPTTEEVITTTVTTTTNITEIVVTESHLTEKRVQEREVTYNTTILTDQDVYQLVETDSGMYFLYQGKMYEVKALAGHGDTKMVPLQPDMDLITAKEGSDLRNKNGTSNGLFGSLSSNTGNPDGLDFRYVGNGVASTLKVNRYKPKLDSQGRLQYDSKGNVILENGDLTNHQFALKDAYGNIHYVYCCDIATDAVSGYYYDIQNLKDADYYQGGDDAVDHIRGIAMNGFWGKETSVSDPYAQGSLAAVKKMMKRNVNALITIMKDTYEKNYTKAQMEALIDSLTEGQALTATQAAIWKFGNMDGNRRLGDTIVQARTNGTSVASSHEDSVNTQLLYELLISDVIKNQTPATETDILDKNDITGASLEIKEEATNKNGKPKTDANGNKLYKTDLTFMLAVEKSSLTGNLKVVIKDHKGNVIREEQLVTDSSNFVGKLLAENTGDKSGSYTIRDLELAEGVKFNLSLEGYQNLKTGVYLYSSEAVEKGEEEIISQTFVGVSQGKRDVKLSVDLKFDVEDPQIVHKPSQQKQTRTHTVKGTKTDTRTFTRNNTQTVTGGTIATDVSHAIDIFGTVTTISTKTDITHTERSWEAAYSRTRDLEEEKTGYEEVPLADAPLTGDISLLLGALSLISLAGVLMLKKKEDAAAV